MDASMQNFEGRHKEAHVRANIVAGENGPFQSFRIATNDMENEIVLLTDRPDLLRKIAKVAAGAADALAGARARYKAVADTRPDPNTVIGHDGTTVPDLTDPAYVPTVAEALADPAGFVAGMTETQRIHTAGAAATYSRAAARAEAEEDSAAHVDPPIDVDEALSRR